MEFTEQLRVLQTAEGDPAKLALATVDLAFPALPEGQRGVLKKTLEAAAIPHWCDPAILAGLLEITVQDALARHVRLCRLTVVEPFVARGEIAVNVHEAARLAVRKSLAADQTNRFRTLCERAATHFAKDSTPAARIEWIYHRLCYAPDDAATELERLDRDWSSTAGLEDRHALAMALQELVGTGLVTARALLRASLCIARVRVTRGETAEVGEDALSIRKLARDLRDARAEADAECLLGDVLQAQGKLEAAQAAFAESVAISRRLAQQDPSNAGWQRDLAVAHTRVGEVLQAQVNAARAAFQNLSNASAQRGVAAKILVIGDIREATHDFLNQLDEEGAVFAAESADGARALAAAHPDADLMLLDLNLPGVHGVSLLAELRGTYPMIPVVVLSGSAASGDVLEAIDAGAMGFIPTSWSKDVMLHALRIVLSGTPFVPREALGMPALPGESERARFAGAYSRPLTPRDVGLTHRQAQVLALIAQGKPNKLICRELQLAEVTVKIAVAAIYRALNVANRTQAVIETSRLGLKFDESPAIDELHGARRE